MATWDTMPDPLANNPRMEYLYTGRLDSTALEDLKNSESDDWGNEGQKAEERNQRILGWLQDFIAQNPERVIDNTFSLAQPAFENIPVYYEHVEQDFPVFPPPRSAPNRPQKALKKSAKKSANTLKPLTKDDITTTHEKTSTTQKYSAHTNNTTELDSSAHNSSSSTERSFHHANANFASPSPAEATAGINNSWNRHLEQWTTPQGGNFLSKNPPKSIGGSVDSSANIEEQQKFLDQEILDKSHGPWKECRCEQCYEDNETEYDQHRAECEDCRDEYFNHEMFDGKSKGYWERFDQKFRDADDMCKLCRWKGDIKQHPYYREVSSVSGGKDQIESKKLEDGFTKTEKEEME